MFWTELLSSPHWPAIASITFAPDIWYDANATRTVASANSFDFISVPDDAFAFGFTIDDHRKGTFSAVLFGEFVDFNYGF